MEELLVITQYYSPEPFRITDMCETWVQNGKKVTVITGIPNYPEGKFYKGYGWFKRRKEVINGVNIVRLPIISRGKSKIRLILNYLSFWIVGVLWAKFSKTMANQVFIFEVSPMTQAFVGTVFAKRRNIPCSIYVQDLWPENLEAVANITNRTILKSIDKIVDAIYSDCDYILATSPSFKGRLDQRTSTHTEDGNSKVYYWPQYAEDFYRPVEREKRPEDISDKNIFRIGFTGNVGYAQGLDVLPKVAAELKKKDIKAEFVIIGDGRYLFEFKTLVSKLQVNDYFCFLGRKDSREIPKYLAWCDAGFISFSNNELFNMTIPAKLQSYMACGKMIIGYAGGETKRIMEEAQCGLCVSNGCEDELVSEISNCVNGRYNCSEFETNSINYFKTHFDKNTLLEQFNTIVRNDKQEGDENGN